MLFVLKNQSDSSTLLDGGKSVTRVQLLWHNITIADRQRNAISRLHPLRFDGHFPGEPGLAGFIEAKDDGSGGDNWSCKSCKAPVKSSPPTNQHPTFYRQTPFQSPNQQCQSTEGKSTKATDQDCSPHARAYWRATTIYTVNDHTRVLLRGPPACCKRRGCVVTSARWTQERSTETVQ